MALGEEALGLPHCVNDRVVGVLGRDAHGQVSDDAVAPELKDVVLALAQQRHLDPRKRLGNALERQPAVAFHDMSWGRRWDT